MNATTDPRTVTFHATISKSRAAQSHDGQQATARPYTAMGNAYGHLLVTFSDGESLVVHPSEVEEI